MVENRRNATVEGYKNTNKMVGSHTLLCYLTIFICVYKANALHTAEIIVVFLPSDISM